MERFNERVKGIMGACVVCREGEEVCVCVCVCGSLLRNKKVPDNMSHTHSRTLTFTNTLGTTDEMGDSV